MVAKGNLRIQEYHVDQLGTNDSLLSSSMCFFLRCIYFTCSWESSPSISTCC